MFSYLRPHHRRTPSNPTSPADQRQSPEPTQHSDHSHPHRPPDAGLLDPPPKTSPLLNLPPVARVTSAEPNLESSRIRTFEGGARLQQWEASRDILRSQESYNYGNRQRMPYAGNQYPDPAGNAAWSNYTNSRYTAQQNGREYDVHSRQKPSDSSLSNIADIQNKSSPTGRRPNLATLPSPSPPTNGFSTFETTQPRSSKTRLNLLNPMSLLARRRTSQAVTQLSSESLVSSRVGNNFNDSDDPRIHGTVVHDFSAPRAPKRNISYNDVRVDTNIGRLNQQNQRSSNINHDSNNVDDNATSPWSGGNHTPVFTENFEEEQYPAAGPHVRKASDVSDLPLPQPPYAKGVQKLLEPTSTSKSNVLGNTGNISEGMPMPDRPPPVPPKSERRLSNEPPQAFVVDTLVTPPKSIPSKKRRSRNVSIASIQDANGPKHMKSTSSRFSFDMIGAAEQERLLEDRHRQRALEKQALAPNDDERLDEEFDDDYDYEDMDDDDGLEERIPGVNADLDEEDPIYGHGDFEEPIPGVNTDLEELVPGVNYDVHEKPQAISNQISQIPMDGFKFQQSPIVSPVSPLSPGIVSTPRDANGEVIGFAVTKNSPFPRGVMSPDSILSPLSSVSPESRKDFDNALIDGLGLQNLEIQQPTELEQQPLPSIEKGHPVSTLDDDDLYFDDGMIGELGDDHVPVEFDESVFDNIDTDEYGRPINPLPTIPTLYSPPMLRMQSSQSLSNATLKADDNKDRSEDNSEVLPSKSDLVPQPSVSGLNMNNNLNAPHPSLTQDTLAAYQSALAAAAFSAAANGKFRRDSVATNPNPSEDEAQPGLVTDSSQTSHYEPFSPTYDLDDEDNFDYDDLLEDDAIIAAANAEALANDCDGFYGQEFGFYSVPGGSEAEYANGGYFGPRGIEGINRNPSGRILSREPNLTPITERSEYSNRNSFMSLSAMYGPSSLASPGLTQLTSMLRSPSYDGDMSLDALLRLRRGAWGGSQASLHSSNGNGSPKSPGPPGEESESPGGAQRMSWSQQSGGGFGAGNGNGNGNEGGERLGHWRKNSEVSVLSEGSAGMQSGEEGSMPASPTLVLDSSGFPTAGSSWNDERQERAVNKDEKFHKKHRATRSEESISYSKEDDPVVGERWVLERKRTAESGEVELLGREVVKGGRI